LVELRTVLERLRPIDRRLKYQIDKLVKTAVTGESTDASSFRANPDNMASKVKCQNICFPNYQKLKINSHKPQDKIYSQDMPENKLCDHFSVGG